MEGAKFTRVKAIHRDWTGFLRLSNIDNSAVHEGYDSKGAYDLTNDVLTIFWENYNPDVFLESSGVFVHEPLLKDAPVVERLFAVQIEGNRIVAKRLSVAIPNADYEVSLRLHTSDIPTFSQVFVKCEYNSPSLPNVAREIVDLGANIGLATVFFGMRYPSARILSVEPEEGNFAAMIANTAALGDRVQKQRAAVWVRDDFINLRNESEDGTWLDAWGVQVSELESKSRKKTKCYKLSTLLDKAGFISVDVLKIDIEGAELEIFSHGAAEWLPRINLIIIETHDRFRTGSEDAVRKAIQPMFEELPRSGENLVFRRRIT
jgi:FkbM family methyltransferase